MNVEFGELPPSGKPGRHHPHEQIAAALRERPGEWARVLSDVSTNMSAVIRNGIVAAYRPAGSFEATTRARGKKSRVDIWARYVGGDS